MRGLRALPPLCTLLIIVGGIWTGVFTPTVAGAIACSYAFFFAFVVYRDVFFADFLDVLARTARSTAGCSRALVSRRSSRSCSAISTSHHDPDGRDVWLLPRDRVCSMSDVEAVLIFTPIFMLTIQILGIDPLFFGIMMVIALSVGVITPPFGKVLFALAEITELRFEQVVWAVLPFLIPILLVIALLILFRGQVTALPTLVR
jgi:TRAP-type C4-dicarboxylate transport system permease large subunit